MLAGVVAFVMLGGAAQAGTPAPERMRELVHMVRQDCGSCHGLTLQGGLGPALTPQALRDKPVEALVITVMAGRPGTPMPPFRGILSEADAAWVIEQLMRGFPEDGGTVPAAALR
ncbi:MAG: cytochrome c [Rhodocyclales bacterium]|nr:cytochrome c [Rhodocyclales bacterium]